MTTINKPPSTKEMEARVELGVAWLDENLGPDWVFFVDLDTLDMEDSRNCVLGQLFKDSAQVAYPFDHVYETGYHAVTSRGTQFTLGMGWRWAEACGFNLSSVWSWSDRAQAHAHTRFKNAWIRAIEARRDELEILEELSA